MSRNYEIRLTIKSADSEVLEAAGDAVTGMWDWESEQSGSNYLYLQGCGALCGGKWEDEFVEELATAIAKAVNSDDVSVETLVLCLDHLPWESYSYDSDELKDLAEEKQDFSENTNV